MQTESQQPEPQQLMPPLDDDHIKYLAFFYLCQNSFLRQDARRIEISDKGQKIAIYSGTLLGLAVAVATFSGSFAANGLPESALGYMQLLLFAGVVIAGIAAAFFSFELSQVTDWDVGPDPEAVAESLTDYTSRGVLLAACSSYRKARIENRAPLKRMGIFYERLFLSARIQTGCLGVFALLSLFS